MVSFDLMASDIVRSRRVAGVVLGKRKNRRNELHVGSIGSGVDPRKKTAANPMYEATICGSVPSMKSMY